MDEDKKEKNRGDMKGRMKSCSDWDVLMKKMLLPSARSSKAQLLPVGHPGKYGSDGKSQKSKFDFLMCHPLRNALGCSNREDNQAAIIRLIAEKLVCLEAKVRVMEKHYFQQQERLSKTASESSRSEPPPPPPPPPPQCEPEPEHEPQPEEPPPKLSKDEKSTASAEESGTSLELMDIHLRRESNEYRQGLHSKKPGHATAYRHGSRKDKNYSTKRMLMRDVYLRKDIPSRNKAAYFFSEELNRTAGMDKGADKDVKVPSRVGSTSINVAMHLSGRRERQADARWPVCFSAQPTSSSDSFLLPTRRHRRYPPRPRR